MLTVGLTGVSFANGSLIPAITGCEVARAEGREKKSLDVLSWELGRIGSLLAGGDFTLSGLESLYQDSIDLQAEVKLEQGVPGSTTAERKALQACKKEIQEMMQKVTAEIESEETGRR